MRTPRLLAVTAGLAALALTSAGCAAFSDDGGGASDGTVQVAAAFYPLVFVTERVGGEHVDVESLTQPGGEPHDLELTVEQTAQIASADLVVFERDFQPSVDQSVDQNATGETLDVTEVVELRPLADDHDHEGEEGHEDEHAEEEGHEEEHEHGDVDPHFWTDPLLMADLADATATALGDLDPDHAEEFTQNAADLRAELETLDQGFEDGLAECERDTVVVSHDAFGYWTRYGLHFDSINGLSPGAEPTPADLAELQEIIREEGITTVFSERLVSPALAQSLADDVGVEVEVLDPIEGLTDETADDDYLSLMEQNLGVLEDANGCRA